MRALVTQEQTALALPPYFVPHHAGTFQQVTVRDRQSYRLNPDQMLEGPYFILLSGGMEVTYSVEGRAFLADTASTVNVVTPFLTMRIKEALLLPEGDERITWLSTGRVFRAAFLACGMTVQQTPVDSETRFPERLGDSGTDAQKGQAAANSARPRPVRRSNCLLPQQRGSQGSGGGMDLPDQLRRVQKTPAEMGPSEWGRGEGQPAKRHASKTLSAVA